MDDQNKVTYFAETDYRNKRTKFGIKASDRTRHLYVIGKTGMGKSTMLENMAVQDIQNGEGFAFLDPHGSSAETLLEYIPKERVDDVLYFAPFDMGYPVSFNVMEDVGHDKRHLVASGLMSAFKKIWQDAWSARMEYILNNTILALLEFPDSTLISINRMYTDKDYRAVVVEHITDPAVRSFWVDEFAGYTDRFAAEATPAIQNKIGQFVSNPIIRNIIGQPKSSFDLRQMMDERKIIIVNLSKGRIGEDNANLLGSMLVTKMYLAAMSRAEESKEKLKTLPNFYLYVDEFQSFANESFANILSEARKYKLNLTIAHQYMAQMPEEVHDAVIGNVGTMISFRVGSSDAEILEKEFAPIFTADEFVNLGFTQMYLKLMIDGVTSNPFSGRSLNIPPYPEVSYKDVIFAHSRRQFAETREAVEEAIRLWHEKSYSKERQALKEERKEKRAPENQKGPAPKAYVDRPQNKNSQDKSFSKGNVTQGVQEKDKNRENALRKAVSKTQLKAEGEKKKQEKGPTKGNLNELKEALSSVLKDRENEQKEQGETRGVTGPSGREKVIKLKKKNGSQERNERKNTTGAQEISPDELRKNLKIN
jgi:hypothetical protein